jgi:hypothetical protein
MRLKNRPAFICIYAAWVGCVCPRRISQIRGKCGLQLRSIQPEPYLHQEQLQS